MKALKILWKLLFYVFGTIYFAPLFAIILVLNITETKEKRNEDLQTVFDLYLEKMNAFND